MPTSGWTSLSITTLGISLFALAASLTSLWFTWRSHLRAEAQDKRRQPVIKLDLLASRIVGSPDGNFYCFHVRVRNPSDTDNAISIIEFRIVFTMTDGTTLIAKVDQAKMADQLELGEMLSAPRKIGAHDILTGWCVFNLTTSLVTNKLVESYEVEFHDTHGLISKIVPIIVKIPSGNQK